MIAILVFGAAVIIGSVLAGRVLAGGRSTDPARVESTVAAGRLVGLPLVLLLGIIVLFHLYSLTYAVILAGIVAAVSLVSGLLVWRKTGSANVCVSHTLPAALAVVLFATEGVMASVAAGAMPGRYPSAWSFVAGKRAVFAIAAGLRESDPEVRRDAVGELASNEGTEAAHAVCAVVGDPDLSVRKRAASFLAKKADESCVPALSKATLDPDREVRDSALSALVHTRSPRAYVAIVRAQIAHERAVEAAPPKDPTGGQGQVTNSAPGYEGTTIQSYLRSDRDACAFLIRLVNNGSGERDDAELRAETLLLLGQMGDRTALPVLMAHTRSDSSKLRGNAATGLAQLAARSRSQQVHDWDSIWRGGIVSVSELAGPMGIDCRPAERELIRLLRDPDENVRYQAAKGLTRLCRRSYLWGGQTMDTQNPDSRMQPLIGPEVRSAAALAVHDSDARVRVSGIEVMGEVGDPHAVPLLLQLDKTRGTRVGCEYCALLRDLGIKKLAHSPQVSSVNEDFY